MIRLDFDASEPNPNIKKTPKTNWSNVNIIKNLTNNIDKNLIKPCQNNLNEFTKKKQYDSKQPKSINISEPKHLSSNNIVNHS